jgi:SAM-dependent methyltransferase
MYEDMLKVDAKLDPTDEVIVDEQTIKRYKANYSIPGDANVTAEMVWHHWSLERTLTKLLLASTLENRWTTWEYCYSKLYSDCPWLNSLSVPRHANNKISYGHFLSLIGEASTIYEVGSGEGGLVKFLASHGYKCVATEVTRERGQREVDDAVRLEWHSSDGVNLAKFEPPDRYDVAISTQVIEHIHPDDLISHFLGILTILRPGGRYIFNTPHNFFGPADLSAVFGKQQPVCMHLKEYFYYELITALTQAGFVDIKAVYLPPAPVRRYFSVLFKSKIYLAYLAAAERLLISFQRRRRIRLPRTLLRIMLFTGDAFLVARKPQAPE